VRAAISSSTLDSGRSTACIFLRYQLSSGFKPAETSTIYACPLLAIQDLLYFHLLLTF
jgi:hypothetical protein